MHGLGNLQYSSGSSYIGNFENGQYNGLGRLKDSYNHSEYIGNFKRGKYHDLGYFDG